MRTCRALSVRVARCHNERRKTPGYAAVAKTRPPSNAARWRGRRSVVPAALGSSAGPGAPPPSPRRRHHGRSDFRLGLGESWLPLAVADVGDLPGSETIRHPGERPEIAQVADQLAVAVGTGLEEQPNAQWR